MKNLVLLLFASMLFSMQALGQMETKYASNVNEFYQAVQSNCTIVLTDGFYTLEEINVEKTNPNFIECSKEHFSLRMKEIKNLEIIGGSSKPSKIIISTLTD